MFKLTVNSCNCRDDFVCWEALKEHVPVLFTQIVNKIISYILIGWNCKTVLMSSCEYLIVHGEFVSGKEIFVTFSFYHPLFPLR